MNGRRGSSRRRVRRASRVLEDTGVLEVSHALAHKCTGRGTLTRVFPSGIRTSIYNAVTLENVETLVQFMKDFQASEA